MVFYPNPVRAGTNAVNNIGDGYTISVSWFQAEHTVPTNKIAYHIYYSTDKGEAVINGGYDFTTKSGVFSEGVKYVSIDGSLQANLIGLVPGQEYFVAVRPVEYDPSVFNLSILPIAYNNLRFYPSNMLRQDMSATDLIVPLVDVEGFPNTGVVRVGVELIQYLAIDHLNNNLIVPAAGADSPASLVDLGGGHFYLSAAGNVGQGSLNGLATVANSGAPTETWTIKCIFVQRDNSNNPIANTAQFIAEGSVSGSKVNAYGDPFIWHANGAAVSNGILSFAIVETAPVFRQGDYFTVKVGGAVPGSPGGRAYNNGTATIHTVDGFDGYNFWNPAVTLFTLTEDTRWDRIFMCQCRFEYPNYQFTMHDGYHQVLTDLLSTDLSAADAANVTFPMYDYAGYHRTDPVQLLDGTCVGSYIGGEMGCIDGYGNYNILRGFSLQDQNTQRQDVLLSVDGRDAVLIRRVQTGITCACYLPSSEYPDDRCPLCFAGGTLVRSENGLVPIETIKIGDKVLGVDGKYHSVIQLFKTPFNGKLKSITTTTTTNPILTTSDHPFLMLKSDHKTKTGCGPNSNCKNYINRGDGQKDTQEIKQLPSGRWHARCGIKNHKRIVLGTFDTKELAINAIEEYKSIHSKPTHRIEWNEAKNINENDWLVCKWNNSFIDINSISIPKEYCKNTKLGEPRIGSESFTVDEEFLWIIGLYIAEGSNSKRSIQFALHQKETEYQNKVISFFTKYGFNPKLLTGKTKGVAIEISSTSLANWFPKLCGKLCHNKHIPEQFMHLPDNKIFAIIKGIWDGDGNKRENEIVQTSEKLCLQIAELLHRLGHLPLITKVKNNTLTINGNKRKQAYRVNWKEDHNKNTNRRGRWKFYEQSLSKVKKVEEIDYDGYVYNLEVEGDHTYVVQNIAVHNCYGTKFVFGYEQYFNPRISSGRIRVRTSPTVENLKMREAGLESEYPLNLWTLTVPTIKTRDIIVLFDQDDNEEFRYEVSDVTRNNTILGLDGGQHFTVFRIRKFDPAYQIRIFRNTADFPSNLSTSIGFVPGIPPHTHNVRINEKIMSVSQINQTTDISQGHDHPIIDGVVMEALGHSHIIILP